MVLEKLIATAYGKEWIFNSEGRMISEFDTKVASALIDDLKAYIDSKREPCGECYLKPNEICDICGITNTNS